MRELGAEYIGADEVSHEIMSKGTETWGKIVNKFGSDILAESGEIDRKKLANIVFFNESKRLMLEKIIHSEVGEVIKQKIDELRKRELPPDVVVIEIPLLVEAEMFDLVEKVLIITASDYHRLVRKISHGMPAREAIARLKSQIDDDERIKHADFVIQNDGTIAELRSKLEQLWSEMASCIIRRNS